MDTIIDNNGKQVTVKITGRVDTISSPKFEQALSPLMEGDALEVSVDCSEMEYISSSGLRIFLSLQKALTKNGGTLEILSLNDDIKEVFEMTGFSKIFIIK
ncbi:MAG: STAS domain-containing protein [Candidatus Cryptobacteroides sp.]